MKNKILLGAMLVAACMCSVQVKAQLMVNSDGSVHAQNKVYVSPSIFSNNDTAVTVTCTASIYKSVYGVYSKVFYPKRPVGNAYQLGNKIAGVYGYAEYNSIAPQHTNAYPFNAGVVGTSDYGVGVYGAIKDTFPTLNPGQYAGYFNGNTKVIGTLTCTSLVQTSDAMTKNSVQYLQSNVLESMMQLKPISFYFNHDDNLFNAEDVKSPAAEQMHYGFMAQEVKEVLPDVVYMGQDSILGINYIELIPLLVQTVQEQQKQILELEQRIATNEVLQEDTHASSKVAPDKKSNNTATEYILYQNTPNPFHQDTKIAYLIPESTRNATLYIYNMNGLQVAEYPIRSMGEGSIVITAGDLNAGMYLYSLIADGQVIDTKRMILTK